MSARMILVSLALLSQTGCVAAVPLAAQLVTSANTSAQLCSMAKMPGQTTSLCDRLPGLLNGQTTLAAATPTSATPQPGGTRSTTH